MHELSITQNIVPIVDEAAEGHRVRCVTLEIGKLSGVVSDAIAFCFDLVTVRTALEGASLEIRKFEARALRGLRLRVRDRDSVRDLSLRFWSADATAGRRAERQLDGTDGG